MVLWVGLAVVLVVFVAATAWGVRGFADRVHEPGTTRLHRPLRRPKG